MTVTFINREQAIESLREFLIGLADEEHSVCEVARKHHLLCRGFAQFSAEDMRKRFFWIYRPGMSRKELDELANDYLVGRQASMGVPLACDAQQIDRDICVGWDEFSNQDLEQFHAECFGTKVVVDPSR